jgi:hypothetical protein
MTAVMTRADIAARVHNRLGNLATDNGLTTTPSGSMTEGSYTYAVDDGLRSVGAFDETTGAVDVDLLTVANIPAVLDNTLFYMLTQLQGSTAALVDTTVGPYSQSLSQKKANIEKMLETVKLRAVIFP